MDIKDARSLSATAQEELRKRAVKAVLGGMKQTEAARVFGVTRQAIGRWLRSYRAGGSDALGAKPQGRPTGGTLKDWQASWVMNMLDNRLPDDLKLPYSLWTSEAVSRLIEQKFGLRFSLWTIRRMLRRWGLSLQRPLRRALERNPREVRRWVRDEYPALVREARADKAVIFWSGEAVLRLSHGPSRSGEEHVHVRQLCSAVSNQGHIRFLLSRERYQAGLFIDFLTRLQKSAKRRRIFLIVDRHPVHRSAQVKAWLEANRRIRLVFLPGSASESVQGGAWEAASGTPTRAA
ncbi:putative transposase [Desulfovibrio sp. X2]|uniref:IS630 family transposase n=1 Tax=Desulfovibrio sp. X2 TaxID=941449 RepID=UPI000358CB37|nr:IS630 family transposase [Desulfovibrio sp. X2]EPR36314.1 putative transposase [Desulfovibrio sp. X2]